MLSKVIQTVKPSPFPTFFHQVLTRLRHYLCDKIRADRHLDYLRSRRILTRDDAEEISCRSTQSKRTATLLDILAENPRGLDALIDSIREMRSQNFIIAKITDEVQRAKNEKIESLRGEQAQSVGITFFVFLIVFNFFLVSLSLSLRGLLLLIRQRLQLPEQPQRPRQHVLQQLHAALPPGRRAEPVHF